MSNENAEKSSSESSDDECLAEIKRKTYGLESKPIKRARQPRRNNDIYIEVKVETEDNYYEQNEMANRMQDDDIAAALLEENVSEDDENYSSDSDHNSDHCSESDSDRIWKTLNL
ncbi:hypothetical protein EVAR_67266_1 [Eumeta japonica]|uniref:Uncharacterized protein n=1 Tax=Eumeta variegata TaxID=151549 RepID=A0A4C1ZS73_EUMVA|nr:hypothetical protein EVAR_67266_1 [Eumeta japonica]